MLVAAPLARFIVHGRAGSWIKFGLDAQERQLVAAVTPGDPEPPHDRERATLVDGASGAQTQTAIPRGDYGQFYVRLRDAVRGVGSNPVPPEQALAVTAVVETAIRSAAEGRALEVPLTGSERRGFAATTDAKPRADD